MKIMKTFLSENEGSTTYKFNFENKILDTILKLKFIKKRIYFGQCLIISGILHK